MLLQETNGALISKVGAEGVHCVAVPAMGLGVAIKVEDVALKVLEEKYPDRPLKTNVEFYAAAVLQGVGLSPDLFPATFGLARIAGWSAHAIEQAGVDKIIRPDAKYVGSAERHLPS